MDEKERVKTALSSDDSYHISQRLIEVRLFRNLKQSYIGAFMGITQQAYSILENRKGSIGFNTLLRFCDATDINIELLMATNIPITEENVEFFKANDLSVVLDGYRKMQQQLKFYESMITVKLAS